MSSKISSVVSGIIAGLFFMRYQDNRRHQPPGGSELRRGAYPARLPYRVGHPPRQIEIQLARAQQVGLGGILGGIRPTACDQNAMWLTRYPGVST